MNAVVVQLPMQADDCPLVPAGEYSIAYIGFRMYPAMFNRFKLMVWFRIVGGEYDGAQLFRGYNAQPGTKGNFKVRPRSDLYREFCTLSGKRERVDRLALSRLKGCVIRAKVRTVTHDRKQRALPEHLRYSVIDQLCSVEAGHV